MNWDSSFINSTGTVSVHMEENDIESLLKPEG